MNPHPFFNRDNWPTFWKNAMSESKKIRLAYDLNGDSSEEDHSASNTDDEGIIHQEHGLRIYYDTALNSVQLLLRNGDCIGSAEFTERDDVYWLHEIHVDEQYQRRGLGSLLLKYALLEIEEACIPCAQESDAYEFCLTQAGINLVDSCLAKGMIDPSRCIFPPLIPLDSNYNDVDPCLYATQGKLCDAYAQFCEDQDGQYENSNNNNP